MTGPLGLRALFSIPIGVEEAVIEEAVGWSGPARRDGIRGTFDLSVIGPVAGDSSSNPGDAGRVAKSIESSGALGGPSLEEVAMVEDVQVSTYGT